MAPFRPISIHALCEEGDQHGDKFLGLLAQFLSTPSARRATDGVWDLNGNVWISIHALCEEGDRCG